MTASGHVVDVLAIGDASVDYVIEVPHIVGPDDKAIGTLRGVFGGGMSANLAAAASAGGGRVALVTVVGADDAGRGAVEALRASGVEVRTDPGQVPAQTWFCMIQLDPSGEKALVGARTGAKVPTLDAVPDELLRSARLVAPLADDVPWAIRLARRARAAGARVAIDLESSALDAGAVQTATLLGLSDVVFANAGTVRRLAGEDPTAGPRTGGRREGATLAEVAARVILGAGATVAVLSAGRDGAVCYTAAEAWSAVGPPVDAIDTTGAGDALAGGFLARWVAGGAVEECLRAGVATSSVCVEHLGSRGYLDRPDLDDVLRNRRSAVRTTKLEAV